MTTAQFSYQRVLVATDFSPHAEAALKQAVWLSRQSPLQITLAHAYPDLRQVVHHASVKAKIDLLKGEGKEFEAEVRKESEAKMRKIVAGVDASDLGVKYLTLLGDPSVEVIHAVQSGGFDLVMSGSRGLGQWKKFFVGSTSKRLIRQCPADVWIVKAEHVGEPKVVLAATDFSEASRKAVLRGMSIAHQAHAEFHLLHVIDSNDVPDDIVEHIPNGSSLREEINAEAARHLEVFIASLPTDLAAVQSHQSYGNPWMEISRTADHLHADLIVMGTIGRSGITGLLLGNTAERVLDTCDCSILTIKPEGFVTPV
ncbi:MAG: universal stress protein [Planctomycetota bacterium]|nr:universal stress protein [Planctomycetota bacterium]MDA1211905.1 universal stress protein [Planctomycetota bacterium]